MLVLSRYCDESIYIGDDIIITVVDIRGDRVRLGIQAPASVSVHRQEIYEAIAREKKISQDAKSTGSAANRPGTSLPIDIDTPSVGFGGISDTVPQ